MRLIKVKKDNSIKVSSSTVSLLDPDFCYIPVYNKYNVLVNIGDKVLKDQPLLSAEFGKIVTSPISGVVKGVKNVLTVNGEVQALVIENDFKEKSINAKGFKNDLSTYKYKDLETILSKLYIP
ncbi:MAG: hypothetical protein GX864_04315, partial [Mollicutes bacterium]|nr:hypothetical protein [Mollicutes bacterium]